jgi:hypothetical protein
MPSWWLAGYYVDVELFLIHEKSKFLSFKHYLSPIVVGKSSQVDFEPVDFDNIYIS